MSQTKRIALVILCAAATAFAGPTDNQPGAMCSAVGSGSLSVRDDGEAENKTAALVTAICPAERPVGTGGATQISGKVFVVDQSPAAICCRAVSKNPGAAKIAGAWACSSGSSAAYQTLDVPAVSDAYTFSSFYLECQIPAVNGALASRIQTYRTVQQ